MVLKQNLADDLNRFESIYLLKQIYESQFHEFPAFPEFASLSFRGVRWRWQVWQRNTSSLAMLLASPTTNNRSASSKGSLVAQQMKINETRVPGLSWYVTIQIPTLKSQGGRSGEHQRHDSDLWDAQPCSHDPFCTHVETCLCVSCHFAQLLVWQWQSMVFVAFLFRSTCVNAVSLHCFAVRFAKQWIKIFRC